MSVGNNIKVLRTSKGLTQKDLADMVNVSFQSISKWEKDEVEPDIQTLTKLSTILGTSIDELVNSNFPSATKKEELTFNNVGKKVICFRKKKSLILPILLLVICGVLLGVSFAEIFDLALKDVIIGLIILIIPFAILLGHSLHKLIIHILNNKSDKEMIYYIPNEKSFVFNTYKKKSVKLDAEHFIRIRKDDNNIGMVKLFYLNEDKKEKHINLGYTDSVVEAKKFLAAWLEKYTI